MVKDTSKPLVTPVQAPDTRQLLHYIEDMLLELAQLASQAGETGLAASLAIAAIQAGAAAQQQSSAPQSV